MGRRSECDEFVLLAIHDLRASLRTSTTMAQMLERSVGDKLAEGDRSLLRLLLEANTLQGGLLSRLAEYCQAGEELERFAPVPVKDLLQGAIRTVQSRAGDADVDIRVEVSADLLAPYALQKVFVELLDNAVKYRERAVSVQVTQRRADGDYVLEFRDNGIGFEPEFSELIMQPLKRLHSASSYPGFGLGLAISQRVVQALGGRLWAKSEAGAGSTFSLSIPTERLTA